MDAVRIIDDIDEYEPFVINVLGTDIVLPTRVENMVVGIEHVLTLSDEPITELVAIEEVTKVDVTSVLPTRLE